MHLDVSFFSSHSVNTELKMQIVPQSDDNNPYYGLSSSYTAGYGKNSLCLTCYTSDHRQVHVSHPQEQILGAFHLLGGVAGCMHPAAQEAELLETL